jgi:hypothetical protein
MNRKRKETLARIFAIALQFHFGTSSEKSLETNFLGSLHGA